MSFNNQSYPDYYNQGNFHNQGGFQNQRGYHSIDGFRNHGHGSGGHFPIPGPNDPGFNQGHHNRWDGGHHLSGHHNTWQEPPPPRNHSPYGDQGRDEGGEFNPQPKRKRCRPRKNRISMPHQEDNQRDDGHHLPQQHHEEEPHDQTSYDASKYKKKQQQQQQQHQRPRHDSGSSNGSSRKRHHSGGSDNSGRKRSQSPSRNMPRKTPAPSSTATSSNTKDPRQHQAGTSLSPVSSIEEATQSGPSKKNNPENPTSKSPDEENELEICEEPSSYTCRLCPQNEKQFKDKADFAVHLTFIHYKERLALKLNRGRPHFHKSYKCDKCNFRSLENRDQDQMKDDLIMHYGLDEGVAFSFYEDDVQTMEREGDEVPQEIMEIPAAATVNNNLKCNICGSVSESEKLFIRHLTLRHFVQELCNELPKTSPFTCPYIDCEESKFNLHGLMLHYGCVHKVSLDIYKKSRAGGKNSTIQHVDLASAESPTASPDSVTEIPATTEPKQKPTAIKAPKSSSSSEMVCHICKSVTTFVTQRSLNLHLFLRHYITQETASQGPYDCTKCSHTFDDKRMFVMHCINDHLEQFKADFELKKAARNGGKEKQKEKKKEKEKPSEEELVVEPEKEKEKSASSCSKSASQTPSRQQSGSVRKVSSAGLRVSIPEAASSSPFDAALSAADPGPVARMRKTFHKVPSPSASASSPVPPGQHRQAVPGELSARQRLRAQWQNNSYEPQKARIQDLQEQMRNMEDMHKEAMKRKGEDFEKWITQKEETLAKEEKMRKEVENKMEQAKVENADLQKQLERTNAAKESLEEALGEKHAVNHKISKEKKAMEKKLAKMETEEANKGEQREKEVKELQDKLEKQQSEVKDLKQTVTEKEEEISEVNASQKTTVTELDKKLARMEKQVDHHKNRAEKLNEDKKDKVTAMKEQAKKFKEAENDLVAKIKSLEDEKKATNSQQLAMKKELKKIEKIADGGAKIKELTDVKDSALDSLEKLQKVLEGYEDAMTDSTRQLEDANSRCEDLEANLEEALAKLGNHKTGEKARKELNSMVKRLQATLKDYEDRQFSQISLISGLQKERDAQAKKIKDFEENHTGAEEDLYDMSQTIKKKEKEVKLAKANLELTEQDKAKLEARVSSKESEAASLRVKNGELERQVRVLEREVRCSDGEDLEYLRTKVTNLEGELAHVRDTYDKMKAELLQENQTLKKDLEVTKERNDKLEVDFGTLGTNHETLKTTLKTNHQGLLRKVRTLQGERDKLKEQLGQTKETPNSKSNIKSSSSPLKPTPSKMVKIEAQAATYASSYSSSSSSSSTATAPSRDSSTSFPKVKEEPLEEEIELPEFEDIPDSSRTITARTMTPPATGSKRRQVDTISKQVIMAMPSNAYELMPSQQYAGPSKSMVFNPVTESNDLSIPAPPPVTTMAGERFTSHPFSAAETSHDNDSGPLNEEENVVVCGICHEFDPPLSGSPSKKTKVTSYQTNWVGCNCERWFHSQCTKLSRHTSKFSCKSVKMKCLKKS